LEPAWNKAKILARLSLITRVGDPRNGGLFFCVPVIAK